MKVFINAGLEYVQGYLRYGHMEGTVDIPDDDYKQFQTDPLEYVKKHNLTDELDLVVDDWSVESCGDVDDLTYQEL